MQTAQYVHFFKNGCNQALAILKAFELPVNEAVISKKDNRLIINPDKRPALLALLEALIPHKLCLLLLLICLLFPGIGHTTVNEPQLKWKHGGCYSSWCETGWYSSPAVADLDGNGTMEVVASAYSIVVLNGADGSLIWRMDSGYDRHEPPAYNYVGRTWPGIVIADVDADNELEIVTAHSGGYVSVYDHEGYFQTGWPKRPITQELRGLQVADIDSDGSAEILVTGAVTNETNAWVYEHDGTLRSGWPQLTGNDFGYAHGVFNDNGLMIDLDDDGDREIIIPSDVHYICAYDDDGGQLPVSSHFPEDYWGKIGVWESPIPEVRGWGNCDGIRSESYRANFANGPASAADLDGNGTIEVVVTGNMYDCNAGYPPSKYTSLHIFNADRSHYNRNGNDWSSPPTDIGAPISEDYNIIENCQPNPVLVDLDGDHIKEILFPAYDGKLHAFWLDKQEHHSWPYSVYKPADGFLRFASEPVVADLDSDGKAEVLFVSWPQKQGSGAMRLGKLHVLNYQGVVLYEVPLPEPRSNDQAWNGALAAPTLANIDNDADLEIVINTVRSGFVAYDLPGSAGARILWQTGRNKGYKEPKEQSAKIISPILYLLIKESLN